MAFSAVNSADASALLLAEASELITYYPFGAASKSIRAVVTETASEENVDERGSRFFVRRALLHLKKDATLGVLTVNLQDEVVTADGIRWGVTVWMEQLGMYRLDMRSVERREFAVGPFMRPRA